MDDEDEAIGHVRSIFAPKINHSVFFVRSIFAYVDTSEKLEIKNY